MNKDGYSIFEKYKNKSAKQEIVQEGVTDVLKLRDNQVITEAEALPLQPVKGRYIYFVDTNELYQTKPYKQLQPEGMIMNMSNNWTKATIIQGEDARDVLGMEVKDISSWYIVNNAPSDHTFAAYIGV